jgi:glycosyltransferase involved in cell wall biosynthesis
MAATLDGFQPTGWRDITDLLQRFRNNDKPNVIPEGGNYLEVFARGTAFITFDYGIDGVSIEIAKYARTLVDIFRPLDHHAIHLIGGNFSPQASSILDSEWNRFQLDGIDGWDKWDGGDIFHALFRKGMKSHSPASSQMAMEIYRQAVSIANSLGAFFVENQITLLIPVNIASNPGNIALALGVVFAAEALGIYVLNSNHDFYWESGKPASKRIIGEAPGLRDHFFRNIDNKSFFSLFKLLYPWNGDRWLQVNINNRQSRRLIRRFDFPKDKVFEISTYISDVFFEDNNEQAVKNARLRMGHILSGGKAIMQPVDLTDHLAGISQWMINQQPVILGAQHGLSVDPLSDDLIYMLQPTRIIVRKRIERNLELIGALLEQGPLREEFDNNPDTQLILHITGPTPQEHQTDLEKILFAYQKIIESFPKHISNRIFVAFSAGHEDHPSFTEKQFEPLTIESIYRIADVLVFPSETEGRGLPIIEASASGIPIICSRYQPNEVFDDVVGAGLAEELRIRYTLFPEENFKHEFLNEVANLLLHPETRYKRIKHNREAVEARYSRKSFRKHLKRLLGHTHNLG